MPDLFEQPSQDRSEFNATRFLDRAEALAREIPDDVPRMQGGRAAVVTRVLTSIHNLTDRLTRLARAIDPVHHADVYDPSHPDAAAELIAEKLERSHQYSLKDLHAFWGSGVYAVYYNGDHPAYGPIAGTHIPIYVGKADPAVPGAVTAREQGNRLHRRLRDHAGSIHRSERYVVEMDEGVRQGSGLHAIRLADFTCRFIVLASAYAGAVERNLIRHYAPVWNQETGVCIGFGKHGDAATTRANTRSDWDTIHPGRGWATKDGNIPNPRQPIQIQSEILEHYRLLGYDERTEGDLGW